VVVIGLSVEISGWAIAGLARPIKRPDSKKRNLIENE
jgi:hypothetical protein